MTLLAASSLQELSIENWPIERLIPSAHNARTHSAAQVKQIAGSIKTFGFVNPVLVNEEGGIIAGHGRVLAARKLGLAHVPVVILRHLTKDQERAFRLADNQIALNAGWDLEMLRLELEAMAKLNVDLDLLGFSDEQLQKVLTSEIPLRGSDPDSVPEQQLEPVSRLGDLWELGKHRLLCGDGTRRENLANVLAGRPCSLTFTDPPYCVDYTGKGPTRMKIVNDNLGPEFGIFLRSACDAILSVAQGAIYICMSSSRLHELHRAFTDAGGHWSTYIIWAKNTFTLGRSDYQRQYEPILYGWAAGKTRYWCGARDQGDVWFVNKPFRNDLHPTIKPSELIERAISNSSRPGNVVLDPFGGAGSTMVACENLGRHACVVEIDPLYVDRTIRRWQRYTNRRAALVATGKSFGEIESERRTPSVTAGDAK
jgi:DNA modification methylase